MNLTPTLFAFSWMLEMVLVHQYISPMYDFSWLSSFFCCSVLISLIHHLSPVMPFHHHYGFIAYHPDDQNLENIFWSTVARIPSGHGGWENDDAK